MPHIATRPVTTADLPDLLCMVHALAVHHGDTPALTLDALERDVLGIPAWMT